MSSEGEEKRYRWVTNVAEVPLGGGIKVVIEDDEIALFNLNGEFYAVSDICPHRGAPLSEGFLEQDKIFCPLHCFDFSLKTGESQVASHLRVATYPVKVENGGVFILH